jgi:hypothetical protein
MTTAAPHNSPMSTAFERFHAENPHVYWLMVMLARQWVERTGRGKLGAQMLLERARWEIAMRTSDPEYKMNNNWGAYYARLIMYQEPDLDGLFDLRASEADWWLQDFISRHKGI